MAAIFSTTTLIAMKISSSSVPNYFEIVNFKVDDDAVIDMILKGHSKHITFGSQRINCGRLKNRATIFCNSYHQKVEFIFLLFGSGYSYNLL